ncbi:MAG: winged helix-turn-helix domain-containing protein [Planctomycetota bacterium]|jgi:molybdate transport system regulatory protein
MKVRGKVWLEVDGGHFFGRGRAGLLKAIDREGSIQAAAERLGVSYRHAWTMLKTSEQRGGGRLVETTRGGRGGGGTRLTEYGRTVLELFQRIDAELERLLAAQDVRVDEDGICRA